MAVVKDSATFFQHGNSAQFEYVLGLYKQALKLKADTRGNDRKAEKLMRLEEWYQTELPKLIKKRGRDAHLLHEELVQTMEWKQMRGKFYPQLSYLIKINTPRAVVMETKKAFRKLPNLEQALNALSNLKGVGITMASALLAAAAPESAPFMADECLMAIPDIEGIDYTAKEYLKFVKHIQHTMERLNLEVEGNDAALAAAAAALVAVAEESAGATEEPATDAPASSNGATAETASPAAEEAAVEPVKGKKGEAAKNGASEEPAKKWSAHSVELALWTHYIVSDLRPELLGGMPGTNNGLAAGQNGTANDGEDDDGEEDEEEEAGDEEENENGTVEDEGDNDENSRNAMAESSESESNEVDGGAIGSEAEAAVLVVANGKGTPVATREEPDKMEEGAAEASKEATDSVTPEETVREQVEQTKNGTAVEGMDSTPTATATPCVSESVSLVDSSAAEDAIKAGESLDEAPALKTVASLCANSAESASELNSVSTTDSDVAPQNTGSSNGNNKRSLCCDDSDDDNPELSAPKLLKL